MGWVPNESEDTTLADTSAGHTNPIARRSDVGIDTRYQVGELLGRGGMGEVRLATDARIHREVAVKLMRTRADQDTIARFLREAQVQGALEHPAVPPVHDLGLDKDGQPYFVMKRLAGTTLADVLDARSSSDALLAKWPRRTLLSRLVDVCLAIEFAHTRGVIHRDLKPANIMLGDFGETYVLDWGLARIVGDDSPLAPIRAISGEYEAGQTAVGALLGTPGYMAPEQARGAEIDARTDVFALGCILYEIVTGIAALPKGLPALDVTLVAIEHRPSKRVDVPPELDELCARATAQDRDKRPTARELADGIQAYLDGDRDLERRRVLALEHVARAKQSLARAGDEARAETMREASRAFALDPTNTDAADIISRLVLEPPAEIPRAAIEEADAERGRARQRVLRFAGFTYSSIIGILAILFMFPVRHAWPIVSTMACLAAMSALYFALSRKPLPMRTPAFALILVMNTLTMTVAGWIFGPMLILPIFIVGALAGFVMAPAAYHPAIVVASHAFAFLFPVVLEVLGLTPSTWAVEGGRLVLTPYSLDLTPVGTTLFLVGSVFAQFANTTAIGLSERRGQEHALDRVHAQSWHLKQLMVTDQKGSSSSAG